MTSEAADSNPIRGSILGNRVIRTEDPRLLTGAARYIADLPLDAPLHAVFVRSDIAHGTIESIDVDEARAMPGVVDVWTARELDVAPHHGFAKINAAFARPPLAVDRVRFVGEAVAVVFAESQQQAVDAAQAVWADIEPLPPAARPYSSRTLAGSAIDPLRSTMKSTRSEVISRLK